MVGGGIDWAFSCCSCNGFYPNSEEDEPLVTEGRFIAADIWSWLLWSSSDIMRVLSHVVLKQGVGGVAPLAQFVWTYFIEP